MALSVIEYPNSLIFSDNPARIRISINNLDAALTRINLRITDSNLNFLAKIKVPVINGVASFDLSEFINFEIDMNFDIYRFYRQGIYQTSLAKHINIEAYATVSDSLTEYSLINCEPLTVINGAISKAYLKNNIYEITDFSGNFFTWQPEKKINRTDFDILYFLSLTFQTVTQKFKLYYSNNTTEIVSFEPTAILANTIYEMNAGFDANSLAIYETETKSIVKYEIYIENSLGVKIINNRSFEISTQYFSNLKQFLFKNSLGCFDFVQLRGVYSNEHEISRIESENENEISIDFSNFTENRTVNSGWLSYSYSNSKQAKEYLLEFLKSTEIYEIVGYFIIPIQILSEKYKVSKSDIFNHSAEIEYKYSFTDESYSDMENVIAGPDGIGIMRINIDFIVGKI